MTELNNSADSNSIAIIGMAGRFPGANNPSELWHNICQGIESITYFNDDELDTSLDPQILNNPNYVRARGIFPDIATFDNGFFDMSPREAQVMDPQQRKFLEIAWESLESAGYDPERYMGLIGVFAGSGLNSYYTKNILLNDAVVDAVGMHQVELANAPDYLATRTSFKCNLKGPSISVYTGCSTSLVAVCYACDSLLSYQCDMAIAGGIYIHCPPNSGYLYQVGEMFSADGHTRPFDAKAQGTVFSCGGGAVVLKRFEEALHDRDFIYAVIRGYAVNNDGADKISFTAPSVKGQSEVIAMAQAAAGCDPDTITYLETHGTGTPLGDPIEIDALIRAFRTKTSRNNFCALGAIKANIGHIDAAAGVAGLIKTAFALHHKTLPPSINFDRPNPKINLEDSPFYINKRLQPWESSGGIRRAGVSSFGVGGTNAHIVLEEFPAAENRSPQLERQLLVLSAKTPTALDCATKRLVNFFKNSPEPNFADVAYTLQIGRKAFKYRRAFVAEKRDEALNILTSGETSDLITGVSLPSTQDIVFMFTGQGAQHLFMGAELYKLLPAFKAHVDRCSDFLMPVLGVDLRKILYPMEDYLAEAEKLLNQTAILQSALFVVESALAHLWIELSARPKAMIGHSIGEYVAAYLAGVFTLEAALELVAIRGKLMQAQAPGAMIAVSMSEQSAQAYLDQHVGLAAVNAPEQCVFSGPYEAMAGLKEKLRKSGSGDNSSLRFVELKTSHAFHSAMMDRAVQPFKEAVQKADPQGPQIPFVSNLSGFWITAEQAIDPGYWANHMRQTVRFSQGIQTLLETPGKIFIEMGPGNTLCNLVGVHQKSGVGMPVLSSLPNPRQALTEHSFFLRTVGRFWVAGGQVDWANLHQGKNCSRIALPTYPFEEKRYWIEARQSNQSPLPEVVSVRDSNTTQLLENHFNNEEIDSRPGHLISYEAPTNEFEVLLVKIWQDVLGIGRIGVHDNFFDLGGQSLMAAQVFAKVERFIGKTISANALYQLPTIAKLAKAIDQGDTDIFWSSLVPIQPIGSKRPLFLVHGAEGNVLLYHSLAKYLGEDQPVYGLQAEGLDGKSEINADFSVVASKYIQAVRTAQPKGPYLLGGYCLGGTIALEMAQQLLQQGDEVDLVAMIEIYNIHSMGWPLPVYLRICNKFLNVWYHLLNLASPENDAKMAFFLQKAKVEIGRFRISASILTEKLKGLWSQNSSLQYHHLKVDEAYDKAFEEYVPQKFPGKIDLFVPDKMFWGYPDSETYGYGEIAQGGVNLHTISTYPRGTLVEPFVQKLAERISACISENESNFSIQK